MGERPILEEADRRLRGRVELPRLHIIPGKCTQSLVASDQECRRWGQGVQLFRARVLEPSADCVAACPVQQTVTVPLLVLH